MPGQQRDATAFMTPGCESHSEASRPKPLLGPKETLNIGCWNVRTTFEPSKAAQIAWQTQTRQATVDMEKIGGSRAKGKTGPHLE